MRVAVLSGKGGTGKTFVSVRLALAAPAATYVDCDVEEPDGRLFLQPQQVTREPVEVTLPDFDAQRCTGCRKCVDFCRFHALAFVGVKPMVFPEVCHGCGGCVRVCPVNAVGERRREIGVVERGVSGTVQVVTGVLHPGEASGVPVIRAALRAAHTPADDTLTVIDCPPGSACTVLESIAEADFCLLVTEPTVFGLHNLRMVAELTQLMHKPRGVVLNKAQEPFAPLTEYLREQRIPLLAEIPYRASLAREIAAGLAPRGRDAELDALFQTLLRTLQGEGCP